MAADTGHFTTVVMIVPGPFPMLLVVRVNLVADELIGFSLVWSVRTGAMDYRLCPRNGHTFAVIAGLRLDTTPGDTSRYRWAPRWQTTFRGPTGFEARHPLGL